MSKCEVYKINSSYIIASYDSVISKKIPKEGYEIKQFNLQELDKTMKYNPLQYLANEEDVFALVGTILKLHPYTDDINYRAEQELLVSILLYLSRQRVTKSFADVLDMLKKCYSNETCDGLDTIFAGFQKEYPKDIANQYYASFRKKPFSVQRRVIVSSEVRLHLFEMPEIKNLTDIDELKLEELSTKKQILIIVPSDQDFGLNLLTEMLCSQIEQMYGSIAVEIPVNKG